MKATFNGTCDGCQQPKPRCAVVYLALDNYHAIFRKEPTTLCEQCREQRKRRYRLDSRHR